MYDIAAVRRDFPILKREVHGIPLVYLDNAATSQKPASVIDALSRYYREYNANVHRGVHTLAEEATEGYEQARRVVAHFIGAENPANLIFTRNTTEAINLFAYAWGGRNLKPGDEVLLTVMEHHSNLVPWQIIAQQTGAVLRHVDITEEGLLDMASFYKLLGPKTRVVSVTHMSNVLGTINPVEEIAKAAHEQGAIVLIDGAQSVPHLPVDVEALGCDLLAFSGHKTLGPTGVGALWVKQELLETLEPFMGGGEMIREVQLDYSTWNTAPYRFEAGTPNIADAIAWAEGIEYLSSLGMEQVREHEIQLTRYALNALKNVQNLKVYGPADPALKGGVAAFSLEGIHPHDIGTALDQFGVAVRAGHHCAQPLHRRLGVDSSARASFYLYNTEEEIDKFVEALQAAQEYFSRVPRRAGRSI